MYALSESRSLAALLRARLSRAGSSEIPWVVVVPFRADFGPGISVWGMVSHACRFVGVPLCGNPII